MMKKRMILGIIFLIIIVGAFFGLANLHRAAFPKIPAMSAEKSIQNAIIEKALREKEKYKEEHVEKSEREKKLEIEIIDLNRKLKEEGLAVWGNYFIIDDNEERRITKKQQIGVFLKELIADKESQKIFRQFNDAGITIFVSYYCAISFTGGVYVNAFDGVKKVARWLQEGKAE